MRSDRVIAQAWDATFALFDGEPTAQDLDRLQSNVPHQEAGRVTLSRTIPYLYTLNRTIPYLNTLSRTIPYLYTLNRTIPYLNTLNRTIPYLNALSRTIPYLNTLSQTIPYLNTLSRTIPYLNALSRTIPYLNTLSRTIPYLNTLSRTIPYLNTLSRTIPYLNTLSRTIPYLYTLSRTIPYLNTLNRTIPYLNALSRTIPYLNTLKNPHLAQNQILVGSQSESRSLKTRQPIGIEYHSAETYPILIHGWGTLFAPRHESAAIAYLNEWRVPHPPPPASDQLTLLILRRINLGILTVLINTTKGINSTGFYRQFSKSITTLLSFVFSFLLFIPSPWRETYLFTHQVKVQIGKSTLYIITSKSNMPTLAGNKQLFHPSLP